MSTPNLKLFSQLLLVQLFFDIVAVRRACRFASFIAMSSWRL